MYLRRYQFNEESEFFKESQPFLFETMFFDIFIRKLGGKLTKHFIRN